MVKTSENDFQTLQHTCIGTFNNPQAPSETFPPTSFCIPTLNINFLLGGGIRVLWKHFFQLFNIRRHAIRLSCLSFKTAKCWILLTSPLNRLCLSHIRDVAHYSTLIDISYITRLNSTAHDTRDHILLIIRLI